MKLDVQVNKLPESEVEIIVRAEWSEWSQELDHAAEHLAEHVKIAGFRKGKVPRALLEQKVGKQALLDEAAEHVIQHEYPHILEREHIDALGRPTAEIVSAQEGETLEFRVKTAVVPELVLGEYRSAIKAINAEAAKEDVAVTDEAVDAEIRKLAESRAALVTVDRPVATGDTAVVDFEVSQEGVLIENGSSKQHPLVIGSGAFIPGFEEKLIGLRAGEDTTFELSFPEGYHAKHLAGRAASFHVTVQAVQERVIAPLDDAFAQSLGKFQTLDELRQSFREGMSEEKKQQSKEDRRAKHLDALVAASTVEVPRILIDQEVERMLREFEYQVGNMGMEFEAYLTAVKKTKEQMLEEWEPQAKKRAIASLALVAVAKAEEIAVASEEIEAEMNKALQYFRSINKAENDVDMSMLFHHSQERLQNEKVFDFLAEMK